MLASGRKSESFGYVRIRSMDTSFSMFLSMTAGQLVSSSRPGVDAVKIVGSTLGTVIRHILYFRLMS